MIIVPGNSGGYGNVIDVRKTFRPCPFFSAPSNFIEANLIDRDFAIFKSVLLWTLQRKLYYLSIKNLLEYVKFEREEHERMTMYPSS